MKMFTVFNYTDYPVGNINSIVFFMHIIANK